METISQDIRPSKVEVKDNIILRFAGDSGDGIQLTGTQFSNESALAGNDISTFPDYPAEIRAPAGTLAGVSGFQINFGSIEINTPGDTPDVLVAMNPAALKANLKDLRPNGTIIINEDAFNEKNLSKVGYSINPCTDEKLKAEYDVYVIPITRLTKTALEKTSLTPREIERCKNFFALGVSLWMFGRPSQHTVDWIKKKFSKTPEIANANELALKAGLTYGEVTEIFDKTFEVKPATYSKGKYKSINGNTAMSLGLVAAAQKSGLELFFGAYPITPASDLLHELAKYKQYNITTFQAEDEIAAICSSIGASFAGAIGVTSSSGPGIALKGEALGLAVMVELPLVIFNMQRGGPSTGLPTKTEQSDLLQAIYGRAGEAPLVVLAPSTPSTAFELSYEAVRIAVKYMTPVMLLSDGFINNCSEPWLIPDPKNLKAFENSKKEKLEGDKFLPYQRDLQTFARPWVVPGQKDFIHRIGGLEKEVDSGSVSYDPDNHHRMTQIRDEKIRKVAQEIPKTRIFGDEDSDTLIIGWGSTEGSIMEAVKQLQIEGKKCARIHLHYINPLPEDLGVIVKKFKNVIVPEINFGQLIKVIRSNYLVDAKGINIVRGKPLRVLDLVNEIKNLIK